MCRPGFKGKATGQLSSLMHNRRTALVSKGKASWWKPYRNGAEAACESAGIP